MGCLQRFKYEGWARGAGKGVLAHEASVSVWERRSEEQMAALRMGRG